MNIIRKLFKNHSPYLIGLTIFESIIAFIAILSFVYTDALNYQSSLIITELGLEKLLQSMYSSTWWALILLLLSFIAVFSLATIIYKKLDYLFIGICSWIIMLVLAINLNNSLLDNLSVIILAIPIIFINCIAYNTEKKILNEKKTDKDLIISKSDRITYILLFILIVISITSLILYIK